MQNSIIEKFPIFNQPSTVPVNIKNGLSDIIKDSYGEDASNKTEKACEEMNELRGKCVALLEDKYAKITEIESSILKYCFYVECFKSTMIKEINFTNYFLFQWTDVISNKISFDHDLKFDQYCFLLVFVYKSLIGIYNLRVNNDEFVQHIERLGVCESILILIQNEYSEAKCLNFFPGVISVILGLCELYKNQINIEVLSFNKAPKIDFVGIYCRQILICENILSDLETSLTEFQRIFEEFITIKKRICEIYAYLFYADTFNEGDILMSISCVSKADKILKNTMDLFRNNLGPFKEFMLKCRLDVENKKIFYNSENKLSTQKSTSEAYLPPVDLKSVAKPFSILKLNYINPFSNLNQYNEQFPAYELKCKQEMVISFNKLLEKAKQETEDYYSKISAFNFEEILSPTDIPIPESLITYEKPIQGQLNKEVEELTTEFLKCSALIEKNKPNLISIASSKETENFNQNYIKKYDEMTLLFKQLLASFTENLEEINYFEAKMNASFVQLPSVFSFDSESYIKDMIDIKKLLTKGDTMIKQRDRLITEIKDIVSAYDFSTNYYIKQNQKSPNEIALSEFYNIAQVKIIETNFDAQKTIINHLITRNTSIFDARTALAQVHEARGEEISKLIYTQNKIMEIKKMIKKVTSYTSNEGKYAEIVDAKNTSIPLVELNYGQINLARQNEHTNVARQNDQNSSLPSSYQVDTVTIPPASISSHNFQPLITATETETGNTEDINSRISYLVESMNTKYSELGFIISELSTLFQQHINVPKLRSQNPSNSPYNPGLQSHNMNMPYQSRPNNNMQSSSDTSSVSRNFISLYNQVPYQSQPSQNLQYIYQNKPSNQNNGNPQNHQRTDF